MLPPEDFDTFEEFIEYLFLMYWADGHRAGLEHAMKLIKDEEDKTSPCKGT